MKLMELLPPDCALDIMMLDDLQPYTLSGRAVVWDVDLSAPGIFGAVRSKLDSAGGRELHSIFLVSSQSEAEIMQAWTLGATILVPREAAPAELPSQLSGLLAAAVGVALKGVLTTLDNAFAAMALDKPIAGPEVVENASILVNAISDVGLKHWLNQVWQVDEQTSQHCLLVAGIAAGFGLHMGFPAQDVLDLARAAILHDVGKARIPLSILNKASDLDPDERAIMETHPRIGWEGLKRHGLRDERVLDAVLHHHEYLDGSGYPDGLSGKAIADFVRIITLCDIFGALLERRVYKAPHNPDVALDMMRAMGGKLDPDLFREFSRFVGLAFPRQVVSA